MQLYFTHGTSVGVIAFMLILMGATNASAQERQDDTRAPVPQASDPILQDSVSTSRNGSLEEIVVTAQKREENLQETPIAISALTSATLEARRISDATDISAAAPNLTSTKTPSANSNLAIHIRGIGSQDPILTADAPVSVYLDGVVIGRTAGAIFDLVDLERVEVLRGPQGTLYGRNTTGGAVNFITAKPADEFGAKFKASIGNFGYYQANGSLDTGELGDSGLHFKFSYLHKQKNGYANDLNKPDKLDPGASNTDAFRIAALYDNDGLLRINYSLDYNDMKSASIPFQTAGVAPRIAALLANSEALGGSKFVIQRDRLDPLSLNQGPISDEVGGHTLTVEYDVSNDLLLRSITGIRGWNNRVLRTDIDGNDNVIAPTLSPAFLIGIPINLGPQEVELFGATGQREQDQLSQEINLIGNIGDNIDFVVGAFYFEEDAFESNPQNLTLVVPSPFGPGADATPNNPNDNITTDFFGINVAPQLRYRHRSESRAAFGQVNFDLTDRLTLTGGIRYTEDKKRLRQELPNDRDLDTKFSKITWAASANYDFSDDIHAYARAATGYKAGGFNPRSAGGAFGPENIISYEAGLKTELFDRRVRFNLTGFYSEYEDLQVTQFLAGTGGASTQVTNAGKAVYNGIEVELLANPIQGLELNLSSGYIDRDYKEFLIVPLPTDPEFDQTNPNAQINVADEARFQYSSNLTITAGAQYTYFLDFGKLTGRLDYTYRGDVYYFVLDRTNPFNELISDDAVGRFDIRLALSEIELGTSNATVALWSKNVTNEDYLYSSLDFGSLGFGGVIFAEPRTYGVDVTFEF